MHADFIESNRAYTAGHTMHSIESRVKFTKFSSAWLPNWDHNPGANRDERLGVGILVIEQLLSQQGTLCKYATASVDTRQPFPTRNFSGTRYFLFRRDGTGTVPVPYRFFDSLPRTFFCHGMACVPTQQLWKFVRPTF